VLCSNVVVNVETIGNYIPGSAPVLGRDSVEDSAGFGGKQGGGDYAELNI
jgi:hypothetical protein